MRAETNQQSHKCYITTDSTSCLPKLPPHASTLHRCWRRFRKHLLVSELYANTKFHFRSTAAIFAERKRHNLSYPPYIIHPFSHFAVYKEIVLCIVWCFVFILSPLTATFISHRSSFGQLSILEKINFCTDGIILANAGLCFISGYHKPKTKETILHPKKIAINYLKTFFVCDFVGALPLKYFVPFDMKNERFINILIITKHCFFYPRVITMFQYFRQITLLLRVGDAQHEMICVILFSFFILHWSSCFLYVSQHILRQFSSSRHSWIYSADIGPHSNKSSYIKYVWCLHMAMCHFYRTGAGHHKTTSSTDFIVLSAIMLFGSIYYAYVIVIVLQAVGTANASESKYEELIRQLYDYMRSKKMPTHINLRLRMYYEYRFQKRYFREQTILATLSEHLRHEIKLYTCRHLMGKVELFRGLSKCLVGSIIGGLQLDIYLTNDVIIQNTSPPEYWYVISYGTVAVIHKSGAEICHFEDGEYFGEVNLLSNKWNDINIVATEISEIFRMTKADFLKYMNNESIASKINALIEKRCELVAQCMARFDAQNRERQEILYKVRSGKILEKGRGRRHKEK